MTNSSLLAELRAALPPSRLLLQAAQLAPYESDALTAFNGAAGGRRLGRNPG